MKRVVIDTNVWIRILLAGPITLPVFKAWRAGKLQVVFSEPLLDELEEVASRPRLKKRIPESRTRKLLRQIRFRGELVNVTTIPPRCRDPKDEPFLATAIDGQADAIISADGDLRADDRLRKEMIAHGVELWGVTSFLSHV